MSSVLQADYLQEASLLMAKLCYVEGEYRDALGNPHTPLVTSVDYKYKTCVLISALIDDSLVMYRSLRQGQPG